MVGVTWEQANAFCAWRTDYLLKGLGAEARYVQRYRLPTEAEWEYAARGKEGTEFPWEQNDVKSGVTLTSNAINDALGQAAKEVQ